VSPNASPGILYSTFSKNDNVDVTISEDHSNLAKAQLALEGVTNDVNELKRFSENLQQMMKIQTRVVGCVSAL